jgi:hypothetical protein
MCAEKARDGVKRLRESLASLDGLLELVRTSDAPNGWPDQGIALGLLRRPDEARAAFVRYLDLDDERVWAKKERACMVQLCDAVHSPSAFDASVEQSIRECRSLLKLDPTVPLALH